MALLQPDTWPLRARVAALVLGAAALPLAAGTALAYATTRTRIERHAADLLGARADQLAGELDAFHASYALTARRLARLPEVVGYCAADGAARAAARPAAAALLDVYAGSDPHFRGVALFDPDGRIAVGTEPPLLGNDYGFRTYFREAMGGRGNVSDLYVAVPEVGSVPSIAYAEPVRDAGGAVRGVAVLFVRAAAFWGVVDGADERAGPGSFSVVFDPHGVRIAHSRSPDELFRPGAPLDPALVEAQVLERRFGERTRALLDAPLAAGAQMARARAAAVDPAETFAADSAARGECLAVARRLRGAPWTLFMLVPRATVDAAVGGLTRATLLSSGVIVGFALLGGLLATGLVLRPVRALTEAARAIEAGDLSATVRVDGGGELADLAARFNRMSGAVREARDELERRVAERTEALSGANAALAEQNRALAAQRADLDRRQAREEALRQALVALGEEGPLGATAGRALAALAPAAGAVVLACWRRNADALEPVGAWGAGALPSIPVAGVVAEVIAAQEVRVVAGLPPGLPLRFDLGLAAGAPAAVALVPLRVGDRDVGLLAAGALEPPGDEALAALTTIALPLALAVARRDLRDALQARNEELEAQAEELRAQQGELEAQQAALVAKSEEVVRADRHKSQFLANVSHELRTPLNAIIGFADLLREEVGPTLAQGHARYLDEVLAAARHLLGLIGEVLDLSRIEAGRLTLDLEDVVAGEVVAEALALVEPQARARQVSVATRGALDARARADRARLRQILVNLLSNAVKFSPEGQPVDVDVDAGPDAVRFVVRDRGPGVPPDLRPRLFQPFVQGEDPLVKRHTGSGLGLAISRGLAELQGGALALEDAPGPGATFVATVPAARGGAPAPAARPQVLVVDTDPGRASTLGPWLEQAGFAVRATSDLDEAARLLATEPPAVVLVDPARAEAARALVAGAGAAPSLVVVATAAADAADPSGLLTELAAAAVPRAGRVLVIDDDPRTGEVVGAVLRAAGFEAAVAGTAAEGLAAARRDPPDLLVVDLLLPDASGFEVIEALAGDERTRDRPVLVLTAADLTPAQRDWLRARARALAEKGDLTREAFIATVQQALGRGPAKDPAAAGPVLVVDDHDVNRELARALLERAGWRVVDAPDAAGALALARAERPAAILLDIAMPGQDGFAALAALRADPRTRDVPVAALTALALRSDEERIRAAGFDDYVTKPIDRARLLAVVARLTGGHPPTRGDGDPR
ncbi:MAG: response regulator [Planctomycetes bacterium]|nr:response regulator [Planctomycetota bacterium]